MRGQYPSRRRSTVKNFRYTITVRWSPTSSDPDRSTRTRFCNPAGVTTTASAPAAVAVELPSEGLRLASVAHLDTLASLLFEWRVECEGRLRLLTSIQRYVERLRSPATTAGERGLLLQEISRLLSTMAGSDDLRQRAAAMAITLP